MATEPKIKMDESKGKTYASVFGWTKEQDEKFEKMVLFQLIVADHETKTQALKAVLESKEFKALEIDPNEPNNALMIGFNFARAIDKADDIGNAHRKEHTHVVGDLLGMLREAAE